VTYLPLFLTFQTLLLVGVPQIATGMLAARIGRSLRVGTVSGAVSLLFISALFWTPECPGCDRSLLLPFAPLWAGFALVGSVTELGLPSRLRLPKVSGSSHLTAVLTGGILGGGPTSSSYRTAA